MIATYVAELKLTRYSATIAPGYGSARAQANLPSRAALFRRQHSAEIVKCTTECARLSSTGLRDIEVIDSELRVLLAIRRMVREVEGRPPSTARIDGLLDEPPEPDRGSARLTSRTGRPCCPRGRPVRLRGDSPGRSGPPAVPRGISLGVG